MHLIDALILSTAPTHRYIDYQWSMNNSVDWLEVFLFLVINKCNHHEGEPAPLRALLPTDQIIWISWRFGEIVVQKKVVIPCYGLFTLHGTSTRSDGS